MQILKLHSGNRVTAFYKLCISRTGGQASFGLQQKQRQQLEKCFSFVMEGPAFRNLIFFPAVIAEERQLAVKKTVLLSKLHGGVELFYFSP